jgi:hypothetical protein
MIRKLILILFLAALTSESATVSDSVSKRDMWTIGVITGMAAFNAGYLLYNAVHSCHDGNVGIWYHAYFGAATALIGKKLKINPIITDRKSVV